MPQRGDILELTIESSAFEGTSIAHSDGMVVFVEGGVAGDVVRAAVFKVKKKHIEAKAVEVLKPSPQRTTPRCKYFGTCGGCKWQHVQYEAQLAFKHQHVVDALERIGGFKGVSVLPIAGSDDLYFYRNKLEFSFGDEAWTAIPPKKPPEIETESATSDFMSAEAKTFLGFHVPQRYDKVLDIDECQLQSNLSNDILRYVKKFSLESSLPAYSSKTHSGYWRNLVIREGKNTGDVMVNIVTFEDRPEVMKELTKQLTTEFPEITTVVNNINTRKAQIAVGETEKVYYGSGIITDKIGSHVFDISTNSFFQTNTRGAEKLYSIAKEYAELKPSDIVYDLYCGTGTISIFISDAVKKVVGIDIIENSIQNARHNAEHNAVQNCEFIAGDLKDLLTKDTAWMKNNFPPDVLIIDPPRSGMHPKAVEEIGRMKVKRIVYVSCNPATLARDVKMLAPFGYLIEKVQPVDMFPHTFHIESVAKLSNPIV